MDFQILTCSVQLDDSWQTYCTSLCLFMCLCLCLHAYMRYAISGKVTKTNVIRPYFIHSNKLDQNYKKPNPFLIFKTYLFRFWFYFLTKDLLGKKEHSSEFYFFRFEKIIYLIIDARRSHINRELATCFSFFFPVAVSETFVSLIAVAALFVRWPKRSIHLLLEIWAKVKE